MLNQECVYNGPLNTDPRFGMQPLARKPTCAYRPTVEAARAAGLINHQLCEPIVCENRHGGIFIPTASIGYGLRPIDRIDPNIIAAIERDGRALESFKGMPYKRRIRGNKKRMTYFDPGRTRLALAGRLGPVRARVPNRRQSRRQSRRRQSRRRRKSKRRRRRTRKKRRKELLKIRDTFLNRGLSQ